LSRDAETFLQVVGIFLGLGAAATVLASGWYVLTQKEPLDRNAILVFAKIFFGICAAGILGYLLVKYL